jgi:hypothetical protein
MTTTTAIVTISAETSAMAATMAAEDGITTQEWIARLVASRATTTATDTEGRVNVPLGSRKAELQVLAKQAGTTETATARALLHHSLDRIAAGEMSLRETGSKPDRVPLNVKISDALWLKTEKAAAKRGITTEEFIELAHRNYIKECATALPA